METMTRLEAASKGLKQYMPAHPCKKHGHWSPRYVSNNGCIACLRGHGRLFRTAIGGDVAPYNAQGLHTCTLLTPEHRAGLDRYLQDCIFAYLANVKAAYTSDERIRIMKAVADIKTVKRL